MSFPKPFVSGGVQYQNSDFLTFTYYSFPHTTVPLLILKNLFEVDRMHCAYFIY